MCSVSKWRFGVDLVCRNKDNDRRRANGNSTYEEGSPVVAALRELQAECGTQCENSSNGGEKWNEFNGRGDRI